MKFDTSDDDFREQLAAWLASLDDSTVRDLTAVFAASPGYYPTTLLQLWRAEAQRRGLSTSKPERRHRVVPRMPVCHPQDADWRFTPETTDALLRRAVGSLTKGDTVAHLGTPSTFLAGCQCFGDYRHVLLERNASMTAYMQEVADSVLTIDLSAQQLPEISAHAAILDPPWYLQDTVAFLSAASRLCSEGALIWLCQPASATRPGVIAEREQLVDKLTELGLVLVDVMACTLRYLTPHFEAMSLRSAIGELPVPVHWRTGDLLVLRKSAPLINHTSLAASEQWVEVHFGPVRIKLRATDAACDLAALVPGDVLDNVSRRDPVRGRIGLWTSGNRVFALSDPEGVGQLIELCSHDLENMQFSLARTLDHARQLGISVSTAQRLFDVLLVELQEHNIPEGA